MPNYARFGEIKILKCWFPELSERKRTALEGNRFCFQKLPEELFTWLRAITSLFVFNKHSIDGAVQVKIINESES